MFFKTADRSGFTIAELLVALALLAIIATFAIPKVLNAGGNQSDRAIVLETAKTIADAYQMFRTNNEVDGNTSAADIVANINIASNVPAGRLDGSDANGDQSVDMNWNCAIALDCVMLHNGAYLGFWNSGFGGTGPENSIWFLLDLDGSPTTNGRDSDTEQSIWLVLYFNGLLRSWSTINPGTVYLNRLGNPIVANPRPASDPTWFQW